MTGERFQALLERHQKGLLKLTEITELFNAVARLRVANALLNDELKKARGHGKV